MNNTYYRKKDRLYIRFDYNQSYIHVMKQYKGQWNYATKEWCIQLTLDNSTSLKFFLDKHKFIQDDTPSKCLIQLEPIEEIVTANEINSMLDYIQFPVKLRSYQIEAIKYFIDRKGHCINGSDMGTGKTLISIAYAELLNNFPCLVICPSTVKNGWKKEWNKANPNRTVRVIDSRDKDDVDWKADVIIINYDYLFKKNSKELKLRYSKSLSKKWSLVLLDEIHLCKNEKSLRSRCVAKIVKKAQDVIALSGTIVMNRPKELLNTLNIIGKTSIFADKKFFLLRYCDAIKTRFGWDFNGATNTMELNQILRHYCYFRKEKKDILKELPSITNTIVDCEITNKKNYDKAESDFIRYLSEIDIDKSERAQRAESLTRLTYLKKLSIEGKFDFIERFVKEWIEIDESLKLIVFGIRTDILCRLHNSIKNSVLITGDCNTDEKIKRIEEFKKEKQILIANLNSLSTGVDGLQLVCNNMAFIELPSRPSDLEQAIARIERMGQKNNINVYYLLSQETIDIENMEVLNEKQIITDAVNKGKISNNLQFNKENSDILIMRRLQNKIK